MLTAIEDRITALEGGVGTLLFATRRAAYDALFGSVLRPGDHVITSRFLSDDTRILLARHADRFGIEISCVDTAHAVEVENAYRLRTRMLVAETVDTLYMRIAALDKIGRFIADKPVVCVVDNSIMTPHAFQARQVGAHIVLNSPSRTIAGHGRSWGASITDTGLFAESPGWPMIVNPALQPLGQTALLAQLGDVPAPDEYADINRFRDLLEGADCAAVRLSRIAASAQSLATALERHDAIERVHYPWLESHPQHGIARSLFRNNGGLLSFEVAGHIPLDIFADHLRLFAGTDSFAGIRSEIAHPASQARLHSRRWPENDAGVPGQLIRVGVGIEHPDDLADDISRALEIAGELAFIKTCEFS